MLHSKTCPSWWSLFARKLDPTYPCSFPRSLPHCRTLGHCHVWINRRLVRRCLLHHGTMVLTPPYNYTAAGVGYLCVGPAMGGLFASLFMSTISDPLIKFC